MQRSELPATEPDQGLDQAQRQGEDQAAAGRPDDLPDRLCLAAVSGIGPNHYRALVEQMGSAGAVLAAPVNRLSQVPGIGPKLARRIAAARQQFDAAEELRQCSRLGIRIITSDEADYPRPLRTIYAAPVLLYLKGQWQDRDALAVAIVGSRHCTHYGVRQAERLANALAGMGITVVSGLARGIDTAAHRGALAAGGRTIAVLASGLANIYPPQNRALAQKVAEAGALISEQPLSFEPIASVFPQRNRIISGLSLGVVVVEAGVRSGALITAHHAMEQNREVMAVPGPVDSRASRGCHQLLRDGARLVESAADVLDALGPLADQLRPTKDRPAVRHPAELTLNAQERSVLERLGDVPVSAEELVGLCNLPPAQVLATLSVLEMRRLIRRLPGNTYARR